MTPVSLIILAYDLYDKYPTYAMSSFIKDLVIRPHDTKQEVWLVGGAICTLTGPIVEYYDYTNYRSRQYGCHTYKFSYHIKYETRNAFVILKIRKGEVIVDELVGDIENSLLCL